MQDGRAKERGRPGGATSSNSARTGAQGGSSPSQELLGKLGNSEVLSRLTQGTSRRDAMMAFVAAQLQSARIMQERELREVPRDGASSPHWRAIADANKAEATAPDPTRWHPVARAYDCALDALCRGDLAQGAQLLARAVAIAAAVWEAVPAFVDTREHSAPAEPERGWAARLAEETPVTTPTAVPAPLRALVDKIGAVSTSMPRPMNRKRARDPWWTAEEDREEEEEEDGGQGAPG